MGVRPLDSVINKYYIKGATVRNDNAGKPYLTPRGSLVAAISAAIKQETGIDTELSTTGGTSDGRFIADIAEQVVEFGPLNASIHKLNEHVAVADLEPLRAIYQTTLEHLLAK